MYARVIESANFFKHFDGHWILRFGSVREFVDVNAENMLAINGDGVIVGANRSARLALDSRSTVKLTGTPVSIVGSRITDYFECKVDDIVGTRHSEGGASNSISLRSIATNAVSYASIRPPSRIVAVQRKPEKRLAHVPSSRYEALDRLAGHDKQMETVIKRARHLVDKGVNILLSGETGTGKEVLARALHASSRRASAPFIAVNCAAIPESLIESELFGYRPGTFTGARSKGTRGLILESSGGTLFLDEIGDMPMQLQSRLLRVLSEREVTQLGATRPVPVDLHVISATHRDLDSLIRGGGFRQDLYFRLNGVTLGLPPFRTRSDKEYIAVKALAAECAPLERDVSMDPSAMGALLAYEWPGNIRQLRNALRYALAMSDGEDVIRLSHLPDEVVCAAKGFDLHSFANEEPPTLTVPSNALPTGNGVELPEEVLAMISTLRRAKWNVSTAARELGVCRATIYRAMKKYGIVAPNSIY
jgi:transcriptional regulator of acetoin/glycerol metabolism